ncbi:MAG: tRNA uridine-5-carboxymethylaminomethyl(34) synthesis GTPase MnmE [Saprospiraceae bacterium]
MTINLQDTIVALSTPSGIGAIGVIRLSGENAINICNKTFKGKNLLQQKSHTIHFGTIRDENDKIIDEVLVSLFIAPKSYTGENVVEVSCHGSNYIIQQIIQLFLRHGARMANAGEFTMRAFLNGQLDLSQAEAVADLISSDSEAAHSMAMNQMRGGFSSEIQKLREELIHFASLIELELDFGEEDVEFADRDDLKTLIFKIQKLIKRLTDSFQLGNVIKNGVTTVIAGRPNAGKSTLLNALLNEERAIVSEIAGTTRDTIEEVLNINGIQFRIIDTAGIREATDKIEAIGVKKAMQEIERSSILVYVYDEMEMTTPEVIADIDKLHHEGMTTIVIGNKMDEVYALHDNLYHNRQQNYFDNGWEKLIKPYKEKHQFLYISAKDKTNLEEVKTTLYNTVADGKINLQSTIVSNTRHYDALQKANKSLDDVLNGMAMGITGDFLAQDIRHALIYLGEITGAIDVDRDILGNIFGKFCIGK